VYEPFLGSGTTLAAAEITERVCCGLEIDPKYADVNRAALARIEQQEGRTFEEIARDRVPQTA
jgi:DNA modification methylase